MAGEWTQTTVGEVTDRVTKGTTPTTLGGRFVEHGISFVKVESLAEDGRILPDKLAHIDAATDALLPRSRLEQDDILFTIAGTIGRAALVPSWLLPANTNQAVAIVRPKRGVIDPRFLFYVLRDERRVKHAQTRVVQSVQANFSLGELSSLEIPLPPLAEQKAIAAVLGALDDKIELNRRMNATLEAMARALFQSWFVDFDPVRAKLDGRPPADLDPATAALFPASLQESSLGPIPHGWRAAHLEEIASVGSGKRPEGRCDVLSPECKIPLYGGGGRMGYVPSALYDKPILFTGRVGTLGLIFRTAEPSWPSDNTLIVEPQAGLFDFTYFVLKGFDLITLNRGSTQPLLTQTDLKRQTLVLPTKDVVKAFADVSEPIFRQMVSNERESRTLATLRDTLLPKLLSGELSVAATDNESLSVQKTSKGG
jgi:type I restriction enzyme S subunit